MAGFSFFGNQQQNRSEAPLSERVLLERKYEAGRANLMIAIVLTAINIFAPIFGATFYFMFSLHVPSALISSGMLYCGLYPEEIYTELGLEGVIFLDSAYFYLFLIGAIVITLVYVLCWFMSKGNKVGWMIAATVLFAIDTAVIFLGGFSADLLIDILFHAWVLYYLIVGIISHFKLAKLPREEESVQYESVLDAFSNPDPNNME